MALRRSPLSFSILQSREAEDGAPPLLLSPSPSLPPSYRAEKQRMSGGRRGGEGGKDRREKRGRQIPGPGGWKRSGEGDVTTGMEACSRAEEAAAAAGHEGEGEGDAAAAAAEQMAAAALGHEGTAAARSGADTLFFEENLRAALNKMGVGGYVLEEVLDKVKNRHYQLACTLTFEATHGVSCDAGINHPNQYFSESQKVLQAKNQTVQSQSAT